MAQYTINYVEGNTPGPFNIYLSGSGTLNLYAANVTKDQLAAGYSINFPDGIPSSSVVISNTSYGCATEEVLPFPSQSPSVTPTISVTPSISITPTVTPTRTPSISVTPSVPASLTPSVSITPSVTPSVSVGGPSPSVTPSRTPSPSPSTVPPVSVSVVGGGFSGYGSNVYVDGYITLSSNVSIDSTFSVDVTVSFGTVNVSVLVPAGNNVGSGTTYIGGNDPEPIGSACIVSCDNPAVILTGFTC